MILEYCSNLFKKKESSLQQNIVQVPSRIKLVQASGITSYYRKKNNPKERWDVSVFKENAYICPDMLSALLEVDKVVKAQNGTLYVTDLGRTWELQQKRREDYLNKVKPAYAATPGGSFHQAGRAVDFSTQELNFKDVPKENWLKKFWDIVKPLGFSPIIKIPDLNKSENWHYDFVGKDWKKAYDYVDDFSGDEIDYTLIAKCCILDVGKWNSKENSEKIKKMFVQSQLIRLGKYEIGLIDGILGQKSLLAIQSLGIVSSDVDEVARLLLGM